MHSFASLAKCASTKCIKHVHKAMMTPSSWWFRPMSKIWVKLDHFPKVQGEKDKNLWVTTHPNKVPKKISISMCFLAPLFCECISASHMIGSPQSQLTEFNGISLGTTPMPKTQSALVTETCVPDASKYWQNDIGHALHGPWTFCNSCCHLHGIKKMDRWMVPIS